MLTLHDALQTSPTLLPGRGELVNVGVCGCVSLCTGLCAYLWVFTSVGAFVGAEVYGQGRVLCAVKNSGLESLACCGPWRSWCV